MYNCSFPLDVSQCWPMQRGAGWGRRRGKKRAMARDSMDLSHSWVMRSGRCWAGSHTQGLHLLTLPDCGERQTLEGNIFSSSHTYVWAPWNYAISVIFQKKSVSKEDKWIFFGPIMNCWGCCIPTAEPGSHVGTEKKVRSLAARNQLLEQVHLLYSRSKPISEVPPTCGDQLLWDGSASKM